MPTTTTPTTTTSIPTTTTPTTTTSIPTTTTPTTITSIATTSTPTTSTSTPTTSTSIPITTTPTTTTSTPTTTTSIPTTTTPTTTTSTPTTTTSIPTTIISTQAATITTSLATATPTTTQTTTTSPPPPPSFITSTQLTGSTTTPTTTTTTTTTTLAQTTTLALRCNVSVWTNWSRPYGPDLSIQRRERAVTVQGYDCPELEQTRVYSINQTVTNGTEMPLPLAMNITADNFAEEFIRGRNVSRDILLIVDASASITKADLDMIKNATKLLVQLFCDGFGNEATDNRLALIQFSSDAVASYYSFKDNQTNEVLEESIDKLFPMFGYTCTEKALGLATKAFLPDNGGRFNSTMRSDTLIITDGQFNCGGDVKEASLKLQEVSRVWALGIGVSDDPVAKTKIQSIVSDEDPRYFFSLEQFRDFENMLETIQERRSNDACV
ncbi:hypothetical protein V1264_015922 [Littorina saxatilis]|uniref:VWFA domain-containing protein n=2 Tax=Littorina saxatilis TaxID=31220 RepID=A0AAN9BKR4_9CAEN